MLENKIVFILLPAMAGAAAALLGIKIYLRKVAGPSTFMYLLMATMIYALGYAFELNSTSLADMLLWSKIEYLGIAVIPVFWVMIVLKHTGRDQWLNRRNLLILFTIPVITIILHFTDEWHHLVYAAAYINTESAHPMLSFEKGPWYWVHIIFADLMFISASILLIKKMFDTAGVYRYQISIMLVGSFIPWVTMIIYGTGIIPFNYDINPLGFSMGCLIFAWGIFQYRLFDLVPVAYKQVFRSMRDGVLILDLNHNLVDYNPAADFILNHIQTSDLGRPITEVLKEYPDWIKQLVSDDIDQDEYELLINHSSQKFYYNCTISPILDKNQKTAGKILVLNEITQQVEMVEKLRFQATTDNLTCALNRKYFMEQCSLHLANSRKSGQSIALILMDIDDFKAVNDTYGHRAGDIALKKITEVCIKNLRPTDVLGRYGGDEFAVLLPDTTSDIGFQVAERLRKEVAGSPIILEGDIIIVTVSFGVTAAESSSGIDIEQLLKQADDALYQAKNAGRNCVVVS